MKKDHLSSPFLSEPERAVVEVGAADGGSALRSGGLAERVNCLSHVRAEVGSDVRHLAERGEPTDAHLRSIACRPGGGRPVPGRAHREDGGNGDGLWSTGRWARPVSWS